VYLEGLKEADLSAKGSYQIFIDMTRKVLNASVCNAIKLTEWMDGWMNG
jgi:hypothetical protein